MKKFASITLFIGITAMIFSSCGKYEDGPAISLASKKARVANEWIMEKVIQDGEELESDGTEQYYIYSLEKDGTGKYKIEAHTGSYGGIDYPVAASETNLEWEFNDSKEQIRIRFENEDGTYDDYEDDDWSTITRLKSNEFWLKDENTYDEDGDGTDETHVVETHLKSK